MCVCVCVCGLCDRRIFVFFDYSKIVSSVIYVKAFFEMRNQMIRFQQFFSSSVHISLRFTSSLFQFNRNQFSNTKENRVNNCTLKMIIIFLDYGAFLHLFSVCVSLK